MKTGKSYRQKAGSPPTGSQGDSEPAFLVIGKLRRPHGVGGEMYLEILTDFPERIQAEVVLFVGEQHIPLKVRSCRPHQNNLLVAFEGFTDPQSIGQYRNALVYFLASDRPNLEDGEFYHHQLIGLQALDEHGADLGAVVDILETGANDVLVVLLPDGQEIMVPYTDEYVPTIDLHKAQIHLRLLPGILPGT